MIDAFNEIDGGLFSTVEKADVGNAYQEMGRRGVSLMGWADPFFPDKCIPQSVLEMGMKEWNGEMPTHYTAPVGNEELKREIAKKVRAVNGMEVDPNRNILITPGSDSGLFYSMMPFLGPGDEVIIPAPCYPNNILNAKLLGAVPVFVELKEKEGYQLNKKDLLKAVSEKTKMIILTHPNNPTTTVFNKKSMEILREIVVQYNLILICDQAFEDYTYENKMITPASMEGMFERTITVCSTSKGMGLSGFRVGYMVASDLFMDKYYGAAVSVLGAANTVAQLSVIEAFKDMSFMKTFKEAFDYRRKLAYQIINSIPNVTMLLPESGFLGWINVSKLGNSNDIQQYLVEQAKVFVNNGINYGPGGEGYLRIVLGTYKDSQKVEDALYRINEALTAYQS